jgi:hypothetical protein
MTDRKSLCIPNRSDDNDGLSVSVMSYPRMDALVPTELKVFLTTPTLNLHTR